MTITFDNVTINGGIDVQPEPIPGQQEFTTPGTYTWVAPKKVFSVCVVAVGAGGYKIYKFTSSGSITF